MARLPTGLDMEVVFSTSGQRMRVPAALLCSKAYFHHEAGTLSASGSEDDSSDQDDRLNDESACQTSGLLVHGEVSYTSASMCQLLCYMSFSLVGKSQWLSICTVLLGLGR